LQQKGQKIMMIDYSGQQIGSYRLIRRLGFGGFASVYLGQHVRISTQQAAIKLLHILDVDTKKFQQEAETTAALVHPHIIRLFDYDFHDQMPFLVMDYAPAAHCAVVIPGERWSHSQWSYSMCKRLPKLWSMPIANM
jgi:serine/threonine protein kinase